MFENTNLRDTATGLFSGRMKRMALAAVMAALIAMMAFTGPAAAQQDVDDALNVCNQEDADGFIDFISQIITLVVFAGIIGGTIAIVMGFASQAVPFLDADKWSEWKMAGLKYGWGLPIILYGLSFAANVVGITVDCMLPGIGS